MRNPQHIWTSTTLKIDSELVDVMLCSNGVAKIIFGGFGGIVIYMNGSYDEDPRKVVAAYKIMMAEIEAGFARIEKEKNLARLNSFQKELDSQLEEVPGGNEPISGDDLPDLIDGWNMIEDLGGRDND